MLSAAYSEGFASWVSQLTLVPVLIAPKSYLSFRQVVLFYHNMNEGREHIRSVHDALILLEKGITVYDLFMIRSGMSFHDKEHPAMRA